MKGTWGHAIHDHCQAHESLGSGRHAARADPGGDGEVPRAAAESRRPARCLRTAGELQGVARQVLGGEAHRGRRPLHRGEGAHRRLHDDSGQVEGRSDGMGPPLPQSRPGRQGRRDRGAPAVRAGRLRYQRGGGTVSQDGRRVKHVRSGDGTMIAYDRLGAGPPVILVDGAFCSRAFGPMPKLAPRLARDFTVFMYDRRGRGDSGDTAPYAVEREIEDLDALIREAGGSAFVHAISSGAALALEAAASGRSITKLALYEPPFMVGTPAHLPPVNHHAQRVRLVAEGRRGDPPTFYMKDIIGLPRWPAAAFRFLPMWSRLKAVAPSLPYDSAIMGDFALPVRRAAALTMPTLVISRDKSMRSEEHTS